MKIAKEEWEKFLDKITEELRNPKPPGVQYEWYVSSSQAKEIEALGGIENWFRASLEEREEAVRKLEWFRLL